MPEGLSREEFTATMERHYDLSDQGFRDINSHLSVLNGRTSKTELGLSRLEDRQTRLERDCGKKVRRRESDDGLSSYLTNPNVVKAVLGFLGVALVDFLGHAVPWLRTLLEAATK